MSSGGHNFTAIGGSGAAVGSIGLNNITQLIALLAHVTAANIANDSSDSSTSTSSSNVFIDDDTSNDDVVLTAMALAATTTKMPHFDDVRPVTLSSQWSRMARLLLISSLSVVGSIGNVFMVSSVMIEDHLKKAGNFPTYTYTFRTNIRFHSEIALYFTIWHAMRYSYPTTQFRLFNSSI